MYKYCPYDGELLGRGGTQFDGLPACPKCNFVDYQNARACVVILFNKGKMILLARRGVEPAKGQWDIPGGFVNPNESAEEAVVREALEETNLRVGIKEYLGSIPDVYGFRKTPTLNLCYLVEIIEGELRANSDVAALEWFLIDKIPEQMAFRHHTVAIQLLKEKLEGD